MTLLAQTSGTIAAILITMAVVAWIETVIPLHFGARSSRAHLLPNLALTFITFATNVFLNAAVVSALLLLPAIGFGVLNRFPLPPLAGLVVTVLVLDFSFYVAHVAMHKIPAFWRYHVVHHCDAVVDVTTTVRQHPGEGVIRYAFMALFAFALGAGPMPFAVYRAWSALNGLLEHANIRLPSWLDRLLSLVTTWPNMHKVHHSRLPEETESNYGNIFSFWDRIFSTFTPSARGADINHGIDGFDDPQVQTTKGLLWLPFRSPGRGEGLMTTQDGKAALLALVLVILPAGRAWAGPVPRGAADVSRGVRLARIGKTERALETFARAARSNPALPEAHLNLGLLLAQHGRHSEAQAALQRALALDPEMPEALEGMGVSLLLENRNRQAAATLERAILSGASSADTRYNLALARARLGDVRAAVQACREALRIRPGMTKALELLREIEPATS